MPILKLARGMPIRVHAIFPAVAIVASGAIACAVGAGLLRLLGVSMWTEGKDRGVDDWE